MEKIEFLAELSKNSLKYARIKLKEKNLEMCEYWLNNANQGINSLTRELERKT